MLFIIDGYNFIHSIPPFIEHDQPILELLDLLSLYTELAKGKRCFIVFDGNPPPYFLKSDYKQCKTVTWDFSGSEQSADDYIQIKIENLTRQNECCLVTNDRGLKGSVSSLANTYESCEQFYSRITKAFGNHVESDEKKKADTYSIEQWLSLFQKR